MRHILFVLATASLLTPAALAGGLDTDVDFLSGDASCSSNESGSSDGDYSEDSYWYYESYHRDSACNDTFTYGSATASDDDGDLATVAATAHEGNAYTEDSWRSGSGGRDGDYAYSSYQGAATGSGEDGWDRRIDVHSREGDASVDRSCGGASQSSSSDNGQAWSHRREIPGNETGNETPPPAEYYGGSFAEHSDESSYRSGCDIGANASHGSIDAAAGERDVCNSTYDSSYTYGSNWGPWGYDSWWSDSRRSDSDCSQRGYAEAEGLAASAGPGQTCTASSEEEGGSAQRYHRRESSSCTDGLHANGPDGIHAFVGTTITEWSECNESFNSTTCYGDTYEQRFASFEWSHNPLGPSPVTIFLP